jgi:hypothetical protein
MARQEDGAVWLVVLVESGIPTTAEAYRDRQCAKRRERLLWRDMDWNDDAVGVFRVRIGKPKCSVCETASGADLDQFGAQLEET